MSTRLSIKELIPDSYQLIAQLSQYVANAGIDTLQLALIKIRASQINGCAYCLHKHSNEAIKNGENPERLYLLDAWQEAKEWFSREDQAILKLTEEVTLIADNGLTDETYEEAVGIFGAEMAAKLIMAVININTLNRLGVTQRLHPPTI
jgi:AhpD family alkylhydroperoxidase